LAATAADGSCDATAATSSMASASRIAIPLICLLAVLGWELARMGGGPVGRMSFAGSWRKRGLRG